jgi:predicted DNA-binding transcriptional regulator YafY
MSLLKYLHRFERMHWLIKHNTTGCCNDFARKMSLSKRQLLENISELKEMGAPIRYSHTSSTYYYEYDWQPFGRIAAKD